jgi:hypothetical protein
MSYNAKVYMKQGGDELVVDTGGKITAAGTQANTIANLTITADLTGINGTDTFMSAEQATALGADLAAIATKLNAVIAALEGVGILKTS